MNDQLQEPTVEATADPAAPINVAEVAANIQANYDFNVNVKPTSFHFKSTKVETKDEETGEVTVTTTKRPSLELAIPYPSVQGIIDILEKEDNAKEVALLMDAVEAIVTSHARSLISDDEGVNAVTLDVSQLSWMHIANLPKPERTGGGIPKEIWEEFGKDYQDVMPAATGKKPEAVANAAKILLNKFSAVKTQVPVLEMLVGQLAIYCEASENAANYSACVEFLVDKADTLMKVDPADLLSAL